MEARKTKSDGAEAEDKNADQGDPQTEPATVENAETAKRAPQAPPASRVEAQRKPGTAERSPDGHNGSGVATVEPYEEFDDLEEEEQGAMERGPTKDIEFKRDDQTGRVFPVRKEELPDQIAAWASGIYLVGALVGLSWLLFDFWVRAFTIPGWLGYDVALLEEPIFRLFAYAYIGGALGGALTGIRSLLLWHSERAAFGRRFIWKSLSLPFQGAVLALLVYVLLRTGLGALSGDVALQDSSTAMLSALGIGGLIGYGSHKVFIWLDAQVNRVFRVDFSAVVPNLLGRTKSEAAALLGNEALSLGDVLEEASPEKPGTVIRQMPAAGVTTDKPITVAVVLAKAAASGNANGNTAPAVEILTETVKVNARSSRRS